MSLAALAKQIFDRFDKQIVEATTGTAIPPAFIAGLIANEAGKDKQGNIVRSATRFEPHVYRALMAVRDGSRAIYNRIVRSDIRDASDAAIRALSHSYEATQIMGWHVIKNLHCTIADLRNPDKHFFYTVKLLQLNGFTKALTEDQMDREMREWNTGKETGKTYHANYVANARLIRSAYRELEAGRHDRPLTERFDVPLQEIEEAAAGRSFETFDDLAADEILLDLPTAEPWQEPQSELLLDPTQSAQRTIAVNQLTEAPALTPLPAEVQEPQPYQGVGFWSVIKRDLAAAGLGNFSFASLQEYAAQASGWPEWLVAVAGKLAVGALVVTFGWFGFRLVHFLVDTWKANQKVKSESAGVSFYSSYGDRR